MSLYLQNSISPRSPYHPATMAPFLRILTIIAFAAHSLLGCCLSHGDCGSERESASVEHCCDHDQASHRGERPHNESGQDHDGSGQNPHEEHHDHAECVLGDLGVEIKGTDWQFAFLGSCYGNFIEELIVPNLPDNHWTCRRESVPRHDSRRAARQVWRI